MEKKRIAIIGGSGYVGGELLRILISHPNAQIEAVTSDRLAGQFLKQQHPHLRGRTNMQFVNQDKLTRYDALFLCTPHGKSMKNMDRYKRLGERIIDLSGDFRLNDANHYEEWYGEEHHSPEHLKQFVYGIPELHREEMKETRYISSAGCNATATILALYPLLKEGLIDTNNIIVDIKAGSSESGSNPSQSSHYSERANVVRSFKPTGHRHTAEAEQELNFGTKPKISMTVTSINIVRGILATSHTFLKEKMTYPELIKLYRKTYSDSPFVRLVLDKTGNYRFPEPKLLWGTNYCDIGIEIDSKSNRLVIISAIDNLMKGAAGQAVQAFNIMNGYEETLSLEAGGMHPI
jgi:LysW-gamma-L-alpha-aminoadipyl-6-phosphate/LysW-L-glutamyl-5-phosphate reductase